MHANHICRSVIFTLNYLVKKIFIIHAIKLLTNSYCWIIMDAKDVKQETENQMKRYIMIPRELVYDNHLGDKRVLIYAAIYFSNWDGKDISALAACAGYSRSRGNSKLIQQIGMLVSSFISEGYYSPGMDYIKRKGRYCKITKAEFSKIMKLRNDEMLLGKKINHACIILLLSYIRVNMIYKAGVPEMYSDLICRMSNQIDMSSRSISSVLNSLQKLQIIYNEQLPRYKDSDGGWHSNVTIFLNYKSGGKDQSIEERIEKAKKILLTPNALRRQLLN